MWRWTRSKIRTSLPEYAGWLWPSCRLSGLIMTAEVGGGKKAFYFPPRKFPAKKFGPESGKASVSRNSDRWATPPGRRRHEGWATPLFRSVEVVTSRRGFAARIAVGATVDFRSLIHEYPGEGRFLIQDDSQESFLSKLALLDSHYNDQKWFSAMLV